MKARAGVDPRDTPGGAGAERKPPVCMQPGVIFEVDIERLGVLSNTVEYDREACRREIAA